MPSRIDEAGHTKAFGYPDNQGENDRISNSTTPCVNLGVRGQLRDCSNSVRILVFFPDSSFIAPRSVINVCILRGLF